MRETANFRDAMERLDNLFPNKEWLSKADVQRITGRSWRWVDGHFPFSPLGISKVTLAKFM